jgi:hypothetical protein
MLLGIETSASAGDGSTLRKPPSFSCEDSLDSSELSNSFKSVVLAVEVLCMDSASEMELLLLRFAFEEMLDGIVISDTRPVGRSDKKAEAISTSCTSSCLRFSPVFSSGEPDSCVESMLLLVFNGIVVAFCLAPRVFRAGESVELGFGTRRGDGESFEGVKLFREPPSVRRKLLSSSTLMELGEWNNSASMTSTSLEYGVAGRRLFDFDVKFGVEGSKNPTPLVLAIVEDGEVSPPWACSDDEVFVLLS